MAIKQKARRPGDSSPRQVSVGWAQPPAASAAVASTSSEAAPAAAVFGWLSGLGSAAASIASAPPPATPRAVDVSDGAAKGMPQHEKPRLARSDTATSTIKAQQMLTYLGERRAGGMTGQGPFKHSQSTERALFGVMQAVHDIKLALGRIDPKVADLDGVKRGNDNALLAGLEILLNACVKMATEAKRHLNNLPSADKQPKVHKTWKAGDRDAPFAPSKLKDELLKMDKLARLVYTDLKFHHDSLTNHVTYLQARLADLEDIYNILRIDVDEAKTSSLSRTALSSPKPGFREFLAGKSGAAKGSSSSIISSRDGGGGGPGLSGFGGTNGASSTRSKPPMMLSRQNMGAYSLGSFQNLGAQIARETEGSAAWNRLQAKRAVSVDFVGGDSDRGLGGGGGGAALSVTSPRKAASPTAGGASSLHSTDFSAKVAVAGSIASAVPWTPNEDLILIALVKRDGLHKWPNVANDLPDYLMRAFPEEAKKLNLEGRAPRTSGLCKARWETLLNAYLSVAGVSGVRKTSDLLLAARKSSRDAENIMNEVAGRLNEAKSRLALAGVAARQRGTDEANQRAVLRDQISVKLHGQSGEHSRLRTLLDDIGPLKLLRRKLEEVERKQSGVDASTLEQTLDLQALLIETGPLGAGGSATGRVRHFLRVRDTVTGEIALYWEEPRETRETKPTASDNGKLTRRLHDGEAAGGDGGSTPRGGGSVAGSVVAGSAAGSVRGSSAPSTPR